MTPLKGALALPATLLLATGGILAVILPAASSQAQTKPLCKEQTAPVGGGAYTVENNEWGSSQPECISADGNAGFTVANSAIANSTFGAPGGYTAIYKGCHWGACTHRSGLPVKVSDIHPGTVTTSWGTSQPGGSSDYDVAYDVWFNQTPTTTGQPNGTELMIWLNHHGPVQPFGAKVATNVPIDGRGYDVWFGQQGWNTLSYTMTSGTTSVSKLDLHGLIADAVRRGYISPSWYLIDVEAGFEMWQGGTGLATNSFSVNVAPGTPSPRTAQMSPPSPSSSPAPASSSPAPASSSPAPASSSPAPASSSPAPASSSPAPASSSPAPASSSPVPASSSPAPASTPSISLGAISPSPTTAGTETNATVAFKNIGSAVASNETLVIEVLDSAGTVVGSQASWTGQNAVPQQTLDETYTWTPPSAGSYTVEGLVQASTGQTIQQAQVGTITVK